MDIKQEHYSGKDVSARIDGGLQDSEMNGYLISLVRRQNKILKTINTIYEKQ